MPGIVRLYGTARNLVETPPRPDGVEGWAANGPTTVKMRMKRPIDPEWTRWFNLHAKSHITGVYPSGWHYYQTKAGDRPVYLQKADPEVPTSVTFPRRAIQSAFATAQGPMRYFTCSVTWLIAFAILEGFDRIELWGFELRDTKPNSAFAWERPCVAYWIQEARDRGVEVVYQDALASLFARGLMVPGDPLTYDGPLYGYSTKPEPDWDPIRETFSGEVPLPLGVSSVA